MKTSHSSEEFAGIKAIPFSQAFPHLIAVFILSFILYLWSAPRTVALEDDGLFILAGYFNGIAHPPGYPLYTLFGKLASLVPVSTAAFRAHALSGFFGALSCATLWYISRLLIPCINTAYLVALAYAVSKSFWSQAIIAEVYTLNVFIFLLLLVQALLFVAQREKWQDSRLPMLMAFTYGLGVSNHWPLLALSSPCLVLILWPALPYLLRSLLKLLPFLLLGLTPYLWMVLCSQMQPEISFSGSIDSWGDFWYVFSRKMYADIDASPTADWHDKYQFALFQLQEFFSQFGWLGFILACLGFMRQWQIWPRLLCWAALAGFLGNSFLLILLLNFDCDALYRKIFHVYPLISYAIEALWLGVGFRTIISILSAKAGLSFQNTNIGRFVVFAIVLIIMIPHLRINYRSNYKWAEQYASIVLKSLEPNAVLFCESETSAGPIGYLNLIQRIRPDVSLYSSNGVLFNSRLLDPIALDGQTQIKVTQDFINKTQRPIYYDANLTHAYAVKNYGFFKKVDKKGPPGKIQPVILPEIISFIQQPYFNSETDPWTRLMIKQAQRDFGTVLVYFYLSAPNEETRNQYWRIIENSIYTFQGFLAMLEMMLKQSPNDHIKIKWLLEKAEALLYEAEQKKETAIFDLLKRQYEASQK